MSLTARILDSIKQALSDSTPGVLVTVTAVKGSAPRGVGTSMLVFPKSIAGTIGGGRLEYVAMEKARAVLQQSIEDTSAGAFRERFALGDSLGQCCGGSVELLFERLQPNWQRWVNAALKALSKGESYEHRVDGQYTHVIKPPAMRLILCGAGHVGRALIRVLAEAPVSIHWVDERAEEFPGHIPSNVTCEVTDTAVAIIDQAVDGSAVIITTHRHDLDFELAAAGIKKKHLAYCGLIGSQSKRVRFERLWGQKYGLSETKGVEKDVLLARLVCPIGGNSLSGKEPEMVAIAVAFEVLSALQTWHEGQS